jgi:hypothetical protein
MDERVLQILYRFFPEVEKKSIPDSLLFGILRISDKLS